MHGSGAGCIVTKGAAVCALHHEALFAQLSGEFEIDPVFEQ
jgi:hypothetical protein